jgi:hypothetical protein
LQIRAFLEFILSGRPLPVLARIRLLTTAHDLSSRLIASLCALENFSTLRIDSDRLLSSLFVQYSQKYV